MFLASRMVFVSLTTLFSHIHEKRIDSWMTCRFDCWWYYDIIQNGYMKEILVTGQVGAANWAFFPVYPELIRFFSFFSPVNPVITGILLNQVMFLSFLVLTSNYLKTRFTSFDSKFFSLLYCFSPFSIYFNSLYSETLFILLLTLILISLQKSRYVLAGSSGALLSGTRSVGVLYTILYVVLAIASNDLSQKKQWPKILGLCLFPLGVISFSIYLYIRIGDPIGYVTIQNAAAWGWPKGNILQWISTLPSKNSLREWANLGCLVTAIMVCGYLLAKKYYIEFCILSLPVLLSTITNSITYRYFFVLYPGYLVIAILTRNLHRIRILVLMINFGVFVSFINWWVVGSRFLV
jgi:hypothetical protein